MKYLTFFSKISVIVYLIIGLCAATLITNLQYRIKYEKYDLVKNNLSVESPLKGEYQVIDVSVIPSEEVTTETSEEDVYTEFNYTVELELEEEFNDLMLMVDELSKHPISIAGDKAITNVTFMYNNKEYLKHTKKSSNE